jgi:hypothetical protein
MRRFIVSGTHRHLLLTSENPKSSKANFVTLPLVTDLPQQIVPPSDVRLSLYTFRGTPINHAEHTSGTLRIAFNTLMGYAF